MDISGGMQRFFQSVFNEPGHRATTLQEITGSPGMNMSFDSMAVLVIVFVVAIAFALKR